MSNSIKKNFTYNLILTLCGYIFPLITYPYVSRVLGVQNIGVCDFVDSIINYFVLFSMLGIGSYGVREIAKCKNDKDKRNFVFSNLIAINAITSIIALILLVCAILWIPQLTSYRNFLWIGSAKLIFNMFLIEWFFQGLQDFKYITIRSVIVRAVYVLLVFLLVHSKDDTIIYFSLTVFTTILNSVINWNYSRRYQKLSFVSLKIKYFILPVLVFGYYRILTSMYTTFNVVFLGFTSGDTEVGYFATATKLYSIIMAMFTALTTVMVPKVSELLAEGNKSKLIEIANKIFSILTVLSFPTIIYCVFFAKDIIFLLAGDGYSGAISPFRIVIFLLLVIGMEQIVVQQFLMASSSNRSVFSVSTTGAVVGLTMNLILTPKLGAIGSSISWGLSEVSVLIVGLFLLKKYMEITLQIKILIENVLWSVLYIFPLLLMSFWDFNHWIKMLLSGFITVVLFILINFVFHKNPLLISCLPKRK